MPGGTAYMQAAKPSPVARRPTLAGTMVEGRVAMRPPARPPNRSMATVTEAATMPAKSAGRMSPAEVNP